MNKNTLRTWGIILALILFSGIASVGLPWIRGLFAGGSGVSVSAETRYIVLDLPPALTGIVPAGLLTESSLVLHPAVAFAILTAVFGGAVVVTGGALAFLYTRLDQQVSTTKETEAFQQSLAAFEKSASETVKQRWADRTVQAKPPHVMPRWSIASTTLIFLVFALFAGTAIADTLYPGRDMVLFGATVGARGVFMLGAMLLTAVILGLIYRPQLVALSRSQDETATAGIPWDTIYVVFTGMIFIAIGVGLVLWLRSAPVG